MDPITGGIIASVGGSLLGGLFGSRSQRDATRAQQQTAREGFAAEERMAQQNLAFQREMLNNMAAANMPRQQASNAALQQITDLYGLGDIYAPPTPGSLAGPANFYPMTNIPGAQGMAMPEGQNNLLANLPQFQNVMGFQPGIDYGFGFGNGPGAGFGNMRIY
jgi:hypothetical protein